MTCAHTNWAKSAGWLGSIAVITGLKRQLFKVTLRYVKCKWLMTHDLFNLRFINRGSKP